MRLDTRYTRDRMQLDAKSVLLVLCCAMLLILLVAGCDKQENKIRVGVNIEGIAPSDSHLIKLALEENAAEFDAEIIYNQEGLDELLIKGIDVLVLNCFDPRELESAVKRTHRKVVPVIILDCPPPENLHVEAYIKINYFDAGKMAADYVARELGGKGNVVILEGPGKDETARQITLGMYSILERHESIRIVASERHPDWDGKLAEDTVRSILQKYANNIQAILAGNSQMAVAAAKAVSERRLSDKIITAGIGADVEACKAIASGTHDVEIDKMLYGRGLETLKIAVAISQNKEFLYDVDMGEEEPKIKVRFSPMRLITKENISVMQQVWPQLLVDSPPK